MAAFDSAHLARVDDLVVQQRTSMLSNDMQVLAPDGAVVASVRTEGGALGRMLMGNRAFAVHDGESGPLLFRLLDPATFGADVYRVLDAEGLPLANLVKEFTFLRTAVGVEVVDGTRFRVEGSLWDHAYEMRAGDVVIARASTEWAGFVNALAGRSRYRLKLDPAMPPVVRCAVLGTAIALDLIRAKEQRSG